MKSEVGAGRQAESLCVETRREVGSVADLPERARARKPAQTSAAQCDVRIRAIRVARRDIGEGPRDDASRVDRPDRADRIECVPKKGSELQRHPVRGALEPQLEGADVLRLEVWIAA